ncbi:hypothetical protein Fcan01_17466 [Folsomia candida]|uniref:Uncharacterized protein n=1 Tax=Folsomia candida TaxID=158441 RepID=A0A226DSU2_FOLCA|nr:hypothetical protein Fcan01_17466 [Folsomia candida]
MEYRMGPFLVLFAIVFVGTASGQSTTCRDKCWQYLQCKNSWYNYFNQPGAGVIFCAIVDVKAISKRNGVSSAATTVNASQAGSCGKDCSAYLSCKYSWEIYHGKPEVVAWACKDPAGCACGSLAHFRLRVKLFTGLARGDLQ